MRRFRYKEPSGSIIDGHEEIAYITVSERWIKTVIFPEWLDKIEEIWDKYNLPHVELTLEECIWDFLVKYHATEIK